MAGDPRLDPGVVCGHFQPTAEYVGWGDWPLTATGGRRSCCREGSVENPTPIPGQLPELRLRGAGRALDLTEIAENPTPNPGSELKRRLCLLETDPGQLQEDRMGGAG